MSPEFVSRIVGMVVFMLLLGRLGVDASRTLGLPIEVTTFSFALVGILVGLILTPWLTIRPVRFIRRSVIEVPVQNFLMALIGLIMGLVLALLVAYPVSLLAPPLGDWLPTAITIVAGYLGMTIFFVRAREIWASLSEQLNPGRGKHPLAGSERMLLVDTSVLIDGRIVDIAETGFLGGTLVVPRFVLSELHQVADSSDTLRRNRGRRGLAKLNELQRDSGVQVKIVEDDPDEFDAVDDKLVALGVQMNAPIVTNDFNLNRVAEAQGVTVLNVNALANAVRAIYIPGESFTIHIIQEGREEGQGIGYLEDGTIVIVEGGKPYLDRTIRVTATRLINRDAGRMIFAVPDNGKR